MTSVWPNYAYVEADGYGLARDNDVERTELDDGLTRQEKRFANALRQRQVRGWLGSDADLARFEGWAEANAHAWFDYTDTEDLTTRRARVRGGAGGIRYTARVRDGTRTWDFELTLEGPRT